MRSPLRSVSIEVKLPLAIGALWLAAIVALAWMAWAHVVRAERAAASERLTVVTRQLADVLELSGDRFRASARVAAEQPALEAYLEALETDREPIRLGAGTADSAVRVALASAAVQPERVAAAELRSASGERLVAVGPAAERVGRVGLDDMLARAAATDSGVAGPFQVVADSVLVSSAAAVRSGTRHLGYVVQWRYVSSTPEEHERILRLIGSESGLLIGGTAEGGVWTDLVRVASPPPVDAGALSGAVRYERPGAGARLAAATAVAGTPWYVLVELSDSTEGDGVERLLEQALGEAAERGAILDAALAASTAQARDFWKLRESVSEAQKIDGVSIKHDVSVPVSRVAELIDRAGVALARRFPDIRIVAFGHVGDGNIHYNCSASASQEARA
ncbi:MAG TPA: FAD-linked oxidase C-terminal domain-containing protein, partial [Anaeromyxobacteraceae bacterium]|nr:FAD-linked oxidase C-terminal domain-containing protein [Anaeromyxobacteraceae bacterium]